MKDIVRKNLDGGSYHYVPGLQESSGDSFAGNLIDGRGSLIRIQHTPHQRRRGVSFLTGDTNPDFPVLDLIPERLYEWEYIGPDTDIHSDAVFQWSRVDNWKRSDMRTPGNIDNSGIVVDVRTAEAMIQVLQDWVDWVKNKEVIMETGYRYNGILLEDLHPGDLLWEMSSQVLVMSRPVNEDGMWRFSAVVVGDESWKEFEYLIDPDHEHYGPRISLEQEYS